MVPQAGESGDQSDRHPLRDRPGANYRAPALAYPSARPRSAPQGPPSGRFPLAATDPGLMDPEYWRATTPAAQIHGGPVPARDDRFPRAGPLLGGVSRRNSWRPYDWPGWLGTPTCSSIPAAASNSDPYSAELRASDSSCAWLSFRKAPAGFLAEAKFKAVAVGRHARNAGKRHLVVNLNGRGSGGRLG